MHSTSIKKKTKPATHFFSSYLFKPLNSERTTEKEQDPTVPWTSEFLVPTFPHLNADQYAQSTTAHPKAEHFSFKSTLQNDDLAVTTEHHHFLTNTALSTSVSLRIQHKRCSGELQQQKVTWVLAVSRLILAVWCIVWYKNQRKTVNTIIYLKK